jgi:DNA-binding transcriptional ArsR family regulator
MLTASPATAVTLKAKLFRGFADPSRLSLLEELRNGERTVSELVAATGLSQPNVSNHLACLYDCGLVAREPRGRFVVYRVSDPRISQLLATTDAVLADVAHGVYACTRYTPASDQREDGA